MSTKDWFDSEARKFKNFAASAGYGLHLLLVDRLSGKFLRGNRRAHYGRARPRSNRCRVRHMIEMTVPDQYRVSSFHVRRIDA